MKLVLRAHHLLCLQGFQGYGYDEDFIKNMSLINSLIRESNIKIEVVNRPDDICKKCPNLENGICKNIENNNEIVLMDNQVISKLPNKEEFDSVFLFDIIEKYFSTIESIYDICNGCRWWRICKFVKSIYLNSR